MPASNATVKTPAKKAPVRRKRAAATKSRKAAATPTPQPIVIKLPEANTEPLTRRPMQHEAKELKAWKDLLSLRGIEIVVLPLIFLEAWTIQILNNAGFEVSV